MNNVYDGCVSLTNHLSRTIGAKGVAMKHTRKRKSETTTKIGYSCIIDKDTLCPKANEENGEKTSRFGKFFVLVLGCFCSRFLFVLFTSFLLGRLRFFFLTSILCDTMLLSKCTFHTNKCLIC